MQQTTQQVKPEFAFEGGHLVMFHREPTGLPTVKDPTVNDRDRMQDLLSQEKYISNGYNISMNEAGHDALYQVLKQNFDSCKQMERQLFNGMFKKGWYKLPVADAQSVSHAYNQFKQYQTQFPFPSGLKQSQSSTAQAGATAGKSDQQLMQQVEQALHLAEQGKTPSVTAVRMTSSSGQMTRSTAQNASTLQNAEHVQSQNAAGTQTSTTRTAH